MMNTVTMDEVFPFYAWGFSEEQLAEFPAEFLPMPVDESQFPITDQILVVNSERIGEYDFLARILKNREERQDAVLYCQDVAVFGVHAVDAYVLAGRWDALREAIACRMMYRTRDIPQEVMERILPEYRDTSSWSFYLLYRSFANDLYPEHRGIANHLAHCAVCQRQFREDLEASQPIEA